MRLWHIDLIPFLPKSQLLAQWRELNSIFKKQDKHILINYIYNYSKVALVVYSAKVVQEMSKRKIKIKSLKNAYDYFGDAADIINQEKNEENRFLLPTYRLFAEHNKEYLTICYWNLREKYIRGQKDFSAETWGKIEKFYKEQMEK